jgi:serine phosphatase RsbU (regulator of sigma subunit)
MNYSPEQIKQLEKKDRYLEVINRFALQLLDCQTVDEVLWTVAKGAIAELGYVDCVIYLFDDSRDFLIQRAAHGPKNPVDLDILNPIKLKVGEGIVGFVAHTGIGKIISDTRKDARYVMDDDMRLSEIAVPLMHNGEVIGVIDSEHPELNFFPEEDLDILTTIASMTASKLIQAMYNHELKKHQEKLEELVNQRTAELQNSLIQVEQQKAEISIKNSDLTDSLTYAHRIQSSILPTTETLQSIFKKHFVFYQPKDIVSGDFYWVYAKDDIIYFAVADCTGHGVPGALLSIIGSNALNKIAQSNEEGNTSVILNRLRMMIVASLNASDECPLHDGMDISLCSLNKVTGELKFSGANQTLMLIRKDETIEFKGDKQSIGYHEHYENYTIHEFQTQPGDQIYLYSDGYKDQFGGEEEKKLKSYRFKHLLLEMSKIETAIRGVHLQKNFNSWKGDQEQLDDVCIFGVEI